MPTHTRVFYDDMAAEVTCAVCGTVDTIDQRYEVIPDAWRMDTDRHVYCPRCIRAYVRPDIEARTADRDHGRWS